MLTIKGVNWELYVNELNTVAELAYSMPTLSTSQNYWAKKVLKIFGTSRQKDWGKVEIIKYEIGDQLVIFL